MAYEFNHYYELQNVATGKYVNVLGNHEDGTVKNGETVNLFSRTNNPDQRWALENFGGNGNVRIVLQRGEGWYALNYNTRNTNCIVWHLNTADDTDTVITTVEVENRPNTYYLMLRDRSIYLTAVGTALKWSAYTGEEEQMFTILEPGTGSDGSDSGEWFPHLHLTLKDRNLRFRYQISFGGYTCEPYQQLCDGSELLEIAIVPFHCWRVYYL